MARTMQTARPRKSAAPKRRQGEEQNAGPQPHGEGGHDALCCSDEACASGDEDGQRVVLGEKPLLAVAASTSLSLAQHPAVTIQISNAAPTASLGVHEVVFSQPGASTATAASCGTSAATAAASSSWVSPEQLCLSLLKSANAVNLRFTVSSSDPTFLEKQDVQVQLLVPCLRTAESLLSLFAAGVLQAEVHPCRMTAIPGSRAFSDISAQPASCSKQAVGTTTLLQPVDSLGCCCGGRAWVLAAAFSDGTGATGQMTASDELWLPHRAVSRSACCSACHATAAWSVKEPDCTGLGQQLQIGSRQEGHLQGPAAHPIQLWRLRIGLSTQALSSPTFRHLRADNACQTWGTSALKQKRSCGALHQQLCLVLAWLLPDCPLAASARANKTGFATARSSSTNSSGMKSIAPFDASQLYGAVKPTGLEAQFRGDPPELLPDLRPYQRRAVAWMLSRERGEVPQSLLHPLWAEVRTLPGSAANAFFINKVTGLLSPVAFYPAPAVRGGILSDEMGLGKTVELLATIVSNRFIPPAANGLQQHQHQNEPHPLPHSGEAKKRAVTHTKPAATKRRKSAPDSNASDSDMEAGSDDSDYKSGGTKKCSAQKKFATELASAFTTPIPGSKSSKKGAGRPSSGSLQRNSCSKPRPGDPIECVCGVSGVGGDAANEGMEEEREDRGGRSSTKRGKQMAQAYGEWWEPSAEDEWVLCEACRCWMHCACVGLSAAPPAGEWSCGGCAREAASEQVVEACGATLIVCPAPILHQWRDEICRHVTPGTLSVGLYHGQLQPGGLEMVVVQGAAVSSKGTAGKGLQSVVTARQLAATHVVLTTYDVLRKEVGRQPGGEEGKTLRRAKRYEIVPTPLTRLKWWRVVLDEAQMVESCTAKATEMALKLSTVHRWCVTGTPISRGLEDLQGLAAFLRLNPWADKQWWNTALQRPTEAGDPTAFARLLHVLRPALGGIMWRSAKKDVAGELQLPVQSCSITQLVLSAVERHWYTRQHQACVAKARIVLPEGVLSGGGHVLGGAPRAAPTDVDQPASTQAPPSATAPEAAEAGIAATASTSATLASAVLAHAPVAVVGTAVARPQSADAATCAASAAVIYPQTAGPAAALNIPLTLIQQKKLLLPLLRLRQAACHPQVGSSGIRTLSTTSAPLSMAQILDVLLGKAKLEAEESQRAVVASLHGLAGLLMLEGNSGAALAIYRKVLSRVEENKERTPSIRADLLQRIHVLHNLAQLVGGPVPSSTAAADVAVVCHSHGGSNAGASHALRDSGLWQEAGTLKAEYLAQHQARLASARTEYFSTRTKAEPFGDSNAWYVAAIDVLRADEREREVEEEASDDIKAKLMERETYTHKVSRNASALAGRFKSLLGLKPLLAEALSGVEFARKVGMSRLEGMDAECDTPRAALVEQAGRCGLCRGELGVLGRVCRHCDLEDELTAWEVRLFHLSTKTLNGVKSVTAEEAARHANAGSRLRVGRGGLDEVANLDMDPDDESQDEGPATAAASTSAAGNSSKKAGSTNANRARRDDQVSETKILHSKSDAEQALSLLMGHVTQLSNRQTRAVAKAAEQGSQSDSDSDDRPVPTPSQRQHVTSIITSAKRHLESLEAQRRLFVLSRALSLAQRMVLYAHDELDMSVTRVQWLGEGELLLPSTMNSKVHPSEVEVRRTDLINDRAVAESDLTRTLGTLRYLYSLKTAHHSVSEPALPVLPSATAPTSTSADAASAAPPTHATAADAGSLAPVTTTASDAVHSSSAAVNATIVAAQQRLMAPRLIPDSALARLSGVPHPIAQAPTAGPTVALTVGLSSVATVSTQQQQQQQQQQQRPTWQQSTSAAANSDVEEEHCPICHEVSSLTDTRVVMPCGHKVCYSCHVEMVALLPSSSRPQLRLLTCPTCRFQSPIGESLVVDPDPDRNIRSRGVDSQAENGPWIEECRIQILGSYGTKIEAVLRRVLFILDEDKAAKILIFSSWIDLLDLIAHALLANSTPHVFARGGGAKGFQKALTAFKQTTPLPTLNPATTDTTIVPLLSNLPSASHKADVDMDDAQPSQRLNAHPDEEDHTMMDVTGGDLSNSDAVLAPLGAQANDAPTLFGLNLASCSTLSPDALPSPASTSAATDASPAAIGSPGAAVGAARGLSIAAAAAAVEPMHNEAGGSGVVLLQAEKAAADTLGIKPEPISVPKRKRDVSKLQQLPSRVLLLLTTQGNAGLNLTEAQHVILVEPLLDPAMEAQAIGRVHRIGQTRESHVHRFIMQESIEVAVADLCQKRGEGMDLASPAALSKRGGAGGSIGVKGAGEGAALSLGDITSLLMGRG